MALTQVTVRATIQNQRGLHARAAARLDHPGICRIHDYLERDERDFLVLELIAGRTLREAAAGQEVAGPSGDRWTNRPRPNCECSPFADLSAASSLWRAKTKPQTMRSSGAMAIAA